MPLATPRLAFVSRSVTRFGLWQAGGWLAAAALLIVGWAFIAQQQALLWQRLPPDTVERFVADRVATPLPRLPGSAALKAACARDSGWRADSRQAWLREALAQCLTQPDGLLQGADAEAAVSHYEAMIASQVAAATAWLADHDTHAAAHRAALQAELADLREPADRSLAPLRHLAHVVVPTATVDIREPVGRTDEPGRTARVLRERLAATQARVQALAQADMPPGQRARELALLATGLKLATDHGEVPATSHLTTDHASLADTLEWQRRARGYQERGFRLDRLQALPAMLWSSSVLLLMAAAATGRGRSGTVLMWTAATQLLAIGALMLTDLALTGDGALRYLAERQFLGLGVGDAWWPLTITLPLPAAWGLPDIVLWWPLLAVAAGLWLLRGLRHGQSGWLAPLRSWIRWGGHPRWSAVPAIGLVAAGMLPVLFLGLPAAVSEWLILLGCVGVATYMARQAPHANLGGGLQVDELLVVGLALAVAVGGAVWRGDLGHALVALGLAACFAWLFGGGVLRAAVLVCMTGVLVALAACLLSGRLAGPLAWLAQTLPPHAQDRLLAMFDPFHAGSSDLARVHWLMDSAGISGWGLGYAPWTGIAFSRAQDGLPLQGPSDYVLALVTALWGRAGGLLAMGVVLAVFTAASAAGLRTALRAAMPPAVRWFAAVGGMGCGVMAAKVVLSFGGVSGVLPLTGLPVALLGYGPVTHLAALGYLGLALGTLHAKPTALSRGVNLQAPAGATGAVRRRGLAMIVCVVALLAALLVLGARQLGEGASAQRHVAQARLDLAQAVAGALLPADVPPVPEGRQTEAAGSCAALDQVVAAWNRRLANLARPVRTQPDSTGPALSTTSLRLDGPRLLAAHPIASAADCRRLARQLGRMLDDDLPRLVGPQPAAPTLAEPGPVTAASRLRTFDLPRRVAARPLDYTTPNAWWGRPGCLRPVGGQPLPHEDIPPDCNSSHTGPPGSDDADGLATPWFTDAWLQRELVPPLSLALRQPVAQGWVNHREAGRGPVLGLTLDPRWQPVAQRIADCFTGLARGAECTQVLPRDAAWRQRHFDGADALRAGALGIVLSEVDSGRVVALAGAVSDCSLAQLGRRAVGDAAGRRPALPPRGACAQFPDQRSAWLAQQHPALWMVPPGSSLKPFSLVAGIDARVVDATHDADWKRILAESHERLPIQRTALAAGPRYLDVLAGIGYGRGPLDLFWGTRPHGDPGASPGIGWPAEAYAGTGALRATSMSLDQTEALRKEKEAGIDIDRRHGHALVTEFLAARQLADASVGGGDIRINAIGLVDAWRSLDLQARGLSTAAALHLVERSGQAVPTRTLGWASPQAAARALAMTTGVTASAWKGTAQGACRVVFGTCPPEGLAGLAGKTGSSDFLVEEDSPYAKPDLQLPAKLFGGVFTVNGRRYAVAVTALRVRDGDSRTLELSSSAPAEAALTLMREMGMP